MTLCRRNVRTSSARHPQNDWASEIMSEMLENYLGCYCGYNQQNWDRLISSAKLTYTFTSSEDLGMSPFEVDSGWSPRGPLDLLTGPKQKFWKS